VTGERRLSRFVCMMAAASGLPADNQHGIVGYLKDPRVAAAIAGTF
jgi:hypothetical protein